MNAAFLARFAVALAVGFVALGRVDTGALCEGLARATHALLALAGADVSLDGALVRGEAFTMQVASVCDGTDVVLILGAAILATPVAWARRAIGLGLALVLTEVVNVGRLAGLYVVGASFPDWFEAAHQILWQVVMMAWAVFFYVRWV